MTIDHYEIREAAIELRKIHTMAAVITRCDEFDWREKFDLVFSSRIGGRACRIAWVIDRKLDWHDPDSSYEDDVQAFVRALEEYIESLEKEVAEATVSPSGLTKQLILDQFYEMKQAKDD